MTKIKSPIEDDRANTTENAMTDIMPADNSSQELTEKIAGVMETYNRLFKENVTDLIVTEANEKDVTALIRACQTTVKQIEEARFKITQPLNNAIKEAIAQERAATSAINNDLRILRPRMAKYLYEKERKARAAAEKIRQEELAAIEQMKKDALEEAEKLAKEESEKTDDEKQSDLNFGESKQEAAIEAAIELDAEAENLRNTKLEVKKTNVRTDFGSAGSRKVWKGDIKDEVDFVDWCVENKRAEFLKPNPVAWNQFAKLTKKVLKVPGASVYLDIQLTTRKG